MTRYSWYRYLHYAITKVGTGTRYLLILKLDGCRSAYKTDPDPCQSAMDPQEVGTYMLVCRAPGSPVPTRTVVSVRTVAVILKYLGCS